jgi:hypothetical protein
MCAAQSGSSETSIDLQMLARISDTGLHTRTPPKPSLSRFCRTVSSSQLVVVQSWHSPMGLPVTEYHHDPTILKFGSDKTQLGGFATHKTDLFTLLTQTHFYTEAVYNFIFEAY